MPENPTQTPVTPPPASGSDKDARMWCMLCHLVAIIPCIPCLLTVLIWQLKKNEFPAVDVHGKRALNFQISMLIVFFVGYTAAFLLSFIKIGLLLFPVLWLLGLGALILVIMAGIKANNGEDYRYPWSLELIK